MFSTHRAKADMCVKSGDFNQALGVYKKMLAFDNEDVQTHLDIAKTLGYENRFQEAIPHLEIYLKKNPDDIENITFLGECYKKCGKFSQSIEYFQKALKIEPRYDYARRNLLDAQNRRLHCIDPKRADEERYNHKLKTLEEAVKIAKDFFPKGYVESMKGLTAAFDKTATMGGRSNIAQYEHNKRLISISDEYDYANPKLIAAYLIHEFVHGKDNDPYTSICEEQDAYRAQAQYWVRNVRDVYDPEMDYVADLYRQSAKALDDRVAEIYKARDPYIAETSFNHPPERKSFFFDFNFNKKKFKEERVAFAPLKAYEIIV